jgi:N-acylneuraminate cytidylyltransferase
MNNIIAFIPARTGSKRVPLKNIRILGGHPLIAYSIQAAIDSEVFSQVYVSTDSDRIGEIAVHYGARWINRPTELAQDDSPDSEWIEHALKNSTDTFCFAIVRPTSPFRVGETIKSAWAQWDKSSLMKAVEPVRQHPFKMWQVTGNYMISYTDTGNHLYPTQTFRKIFIQNGSLEFRLKYGRHWQYQAFFTKDYEGFDINTSEDFILAEALVEKGYAKLPQIDKEPYDFTTV